MSVKHLLKRSFKILDRNYRKKWGEIDIIAKKDNILHFIEVKSVSIETKNSDKSEFGRTFLPEENVHYWKRKRLSNTIQSYLAEKNVSIETEWQIDIMAVFVDLKNLKAKIRITENVIF